MPESEGKEPFTLHGDSEESSVVLACERVLQGRVRVLLVRKDRRKGQRETSYARLWHMVAYGVCAWRDYCDFKGNIPT